MSLRTGLVVAGLDIGNSTTEVVLARIDGTAATPLWSGRVVTRGEKGSRTSVEEAVSLLRRGEELAGVQAEEVLVAELRPVRTVTATLADAPAAGPVRSLGRGRAATPAGHGFAVGVHVRLADLASGCRPTYGVVASVDGSWDFDEAAAALRQAVLNGVDLRGVLVKEDEAVLICNRIPVDVPVIDEVDVTSLAPGATVAMEVVRVGEVAHRLTDPLVVANALGVDPAGHSAVAVQLRELSDRHALALTLSETVTSRLPDTLESSAGWVEARLHGELERLDLERVRHDMGSWPPGTVERLAITGSPDIEAVAQPVADAWLVSLDSLDGGGWLRRDAAKLRVTLLVSLAADACTDTTGLITELTDRPATTVSPEHAAATAGSRTTPSLPSRAVVCDIGAGTVDCISTSGAVVVAGGGELLTRVVSRTLDIPPALAERVKRTPAVRPDGPHVAHEEDGRRTFLETPASPRAIGKLSVRSVNGTDLVPFSDRLAPEEWRGLRLALKRATVGACAARALAAMPEPFRPSDTVVLAGGGALDDELVRTVTESLRRHGHGPVVTRADVAGRFGPRCAVAWGLVVLHAAAPSATSAAHRGTK